MAGEPTGTVAVEGLRELQRDLKRVDASMQREITAGFKRLAKDELLPDIKRAAARAGLAPPGKSGRGKGGLLAGLKPFAGIDSAGVRSTAKRGSYPYPRRYEFEKGGGRAFMRPGLLAAAPRLEQGAFDVIDETLRKGGL